jgi:hypothetical protein
MQRNIDNDSVSAIQSCHIHSSQVFCPTHTHAPYSRILIHAAPVVASNEPAFLVLSVHRWTVTAQTIATIVCMRHHFYNRQN